MAGSGLSGLILSVDCKTFRHPVLAAETGPPLTRHDLIASDEGFDPQLIGNIGPVPSHSTFSDSVVQPHTLSLQPSPVKHLGQPPDNPASGRCDEKRCPLTATAYSGSRIRSWVCD